MFTCRTFHYICRPPGSRGAYIESNYEDDRIPPELKKKKELLDSFKKYTIDFLPMDFSVPQTTEITKIRLLKYIVVSDLCITFRLSNGVFQVRQKIKSRYR